MRGNWDTAEPLVHAPNQQRQQQQQTIVEEQRHPLHSPTTPAWGIVDRIVKEEPLEDKNDDSGVSPGHYTSNSGSPGSRHSSSTANCSLSPGSVTSQDSNTMQCSTFNYSPQKMFNECDTSMDVVSNDVKANSESVEQNILRCPICNFSTINRMTLTEHLGTHCDTPDFVKTILEQLTPGNQDDCTSPNLAEGSDTEDMEEPGLRVPRVNSQGKVKTFRCKQCNYLAITKLQFWEHNRRHIKAEKLLTCPKCPFVTEYKHHLEYHLRNHFGSKPFKCDKCPYSCVNKSMLNSHLKSHSNVYQYRCANCSYATKYCHSLKLHLRKYSHQPAMVLNADGSPNPLPIIDVYGTRRGPKQKSTMKMEEDASKTLTDHQNITAIPMSMSPSQQQVGSAGQLAVMSPISMNSISGMSAVNGVNNVTGINTFTAISPVNGMNNGMSMNSGMNSNVNAVSGMNGMNGSNGLSTVNTVNAVNAMSAINVMNVVNSVNSMTSINQPSPMMAFPFGQFFTRFPMSNTFTARGQDGSVEQMDRLKSNMFMEYAKLMKNEDFDPELAMRYFGVGDVEFGNANTSTFFTEDSQKTVVHSPSTSPITEYPEDWQNAASTAAPLDLSKPEGTERHVAAITSSPRATGTSRRKGKAVKLERRVVENDTDEESLKFDETSISNQDTLTDISSTTPPPQPPPPPLLPVATDNVEDVGRENSSENSENSEHPGNNGATTTNNEFSCQYCEIAFGNVVMYTVHMGYHGYKDPYTCNMCGIKCTDKVSFFLHIARSKHT